MNYVVRTRVSQVSSHNKVKQNFGIAVGTILFIKIALQMSWRRVADWLEHMTSS